LGNEEGEAGLEVTLLGPTLKFSEDCWIAITGADLGARLNEEEAPLWETIPVESGDVLSFQSPRKGMRAYIAVAGEIEVPPVLGSKATYLRANLGGLEGRALAQGDRLNIKPASVRHRRLPREYMPDYGLEPIRVTLVSAERFTPDGVKTFLSSEYRVHPESDRMGLRLQGPKIEHTRGADIISEPVCTGAVQVPGNGQPIVLLADRQTTGGYTKMATVISADLHKLGQAKPGETVSFEEISLEQAHLLWRETERKFLELKRAIEGGRLDSCGQLRVRTPARVYSVEITREAAREFSVVVEGEMYKVAVLGRKAPPSPISGGGRVHTVVAPMPGEIADVFVSPGDEVKEGQKLLILEAMKMENEILSPVRGAVAEVKVGKGAQVEDGQALLIITVEETP
jgi:biotin-dependent carboxylase-like uncharacterized protein